MEVGNKPGVPWKDNSSLIVRNKQRDGRILAPGGYLPNAEDPFLRTNKEVERSELLPSHRCPFEAVIQLFPPSHSKDNKNSVPPDSGLQTQLPIKHRIEKPQNCDQLGLQRNVLQSKQAASLITTSEWSLTHRPISLASSPSPNWLLTV